MELSALADDGDAHSALISHFQSCERQKRKKDNLESAHEPCESYNRSLKIPRLPDVSAAKTFQWPCHSSRHLFQISCYF